jgi:hypothetical protein
VAECGHGPGVRSNEEGAEIAMDGIDLEDRITDATTRRTIVKTGVKLAYVAPIVAASFKLNGVLAQTISPVGGCFHSTGTNGGCMPACTSAGFTGAQCGVICGTGQSTGACPVGQGGGNPCCNPGYCVPTNYRRSNTGNPVYTGPTTGCPVTVTKKKKK